MPTTENFDHDGGLTDSGEPILEPALAAKALASVATATRAEAAARPEEDGAHRESIVPRGTFASEVPPEPDPTKLEPARHDPAERPLPSGEEPPARAPEEPVVAPKPQTGSQRMRVTRAPTRPPFLASEILREDIAPREPGKKVLSVQVSVASMAGLFAMVWAGLDSLGAIALGAMFVVLFAIGRIHLPYLTRAAILATSSGSALLLVTWRRLALGAGSIDVLLVLGATLLPAALFFRAWYRGSIPARVLVGASLIPAFAWSLITSHRQLLALEFVWQSWLPALTWYVFVILCLLSLLAFMGDDTTGGCDAWAVGLCIWYALYASVRYALGREHDASLQLLGLTQPALAAPLAVSLGQLMARMLGPRGRRETDPPSPPAATTA